MNPNKEEVKCCEMCSHCMYPYSCSCHQSTNTNEISSKLAAKKEVKKGEYEVPCDKDIKDCGQHKYHCGKCNTPISYSPANYASRPQDIPNPCKGLCHQDRPPFKWDKELMGLAKKVGDSLRKEECKHESWNRQIDCPNCVKVRPQEQSIAQEKSNLEKCAVKEEYMHEGWNGDITNLPKEEEEWQKKLIDVADKIWAENEYEVTPRVIVEHIKPLISNLLKTHTERAYDWAKENRAPMGVSQWRNHGEKYGYDKYFNDQARAELLKEIEGKVGILRQLLNEERITDPSKMIDNEYILQVLINNFK